MPSPTLPIPATPLVGREADVARVRTLWTGERLVVVDGPDGVGRSRIAMEAAREEEAAGASIVWVGVAGATDAGAVARAVAKALGAAAGDDVVASVGWALVGRGPTSLVLDTVEAGEGAAAPGAVVAAWLAVAPALRCLVTTRDRGVLPGGARHRVGGLEVPAVGATRAEILALPSVRMFLDRARTSAGGAGEIGLGEGGIGDAALADVAAIVRRTAGLPLAIELCAGAYAQAGTLAELRRAVELVVPLDPLENRELRDVLSGAIEVAWQGLGAGEQRALAELSVFRGGWTLPAAAAVWDVDEGTAEGRLALLVARSLVRVTRRDGPAGARYTLPDPIRADGERRLRATGLAAEGLRRHALHFAGHGTQAAGEALDAVGGAARWRALQAERENLVAAVTRLGEHGEGDAAAHALVALFNLLLLLGPVSDGLALIEPLVGRSDLAPRTRARLARVHGDLLTLAGRLEEAWRVFDAAEVVTRGLGDPVLLSRLWLSTAIWFQERGEPEAAVPYLERALEIPGIGPRQAGLVYTALSTCAYAIGALDRARGYSEAGLAAHREVGNERMVSMTLTNLALIHLDRGDPAEALRLLADALPVTERLHNRRQEADVRRVTALALLEGDGERAARIGEAVRLLREAVAIYAAVGMRRMEGVTRAALSGALVEGDPADAEREAERALGIARAIGNRRNQAMALARVSAARLRTGHDVAGVFAEAVALAEQGLRRHDRAVIWVIRGEAELAVGEDAEARACLRKAAALVEGEHSGEGWCAVRRLERALDE